MPERVSGRQTEDAGVTVAAIERELESLSRAHAEVAGVMVGQDEAIRQLLIGLLSGGHILVEGAPGLGKTLLVRTLGTVCGLKFSRIQFTPDLMPADITGTIALLHDENGEAVTRFQPGPVFTQMLLTDEINRATPKTQSALLEAMQEGTVTVAGQEYRLPTPFFVLATQNPIEMEGTYLLPEAQIDRFFFKVTIAFPSFDVLDGILERTTGAQAAEPEQVLTPEQILRLQELTRQVPIAASVRQRVARFVMATQPLSDTAPDEVKRFVRFGVSPRGAQVLVLAAKANALLEGRYNVSFEDIRTVAMPALRHRVQLNFEGEAEGIEVEDVITRLLRRLIDAKSSGVERR
ncbi:MAG: MoxR family ATPase [Trueperaceae bacterium]